MITEPDYTTIVHVPGTRDKYQARRMAWDARADGYVVTRDVGPLSKAQAEGLARSWATVYQLEYRP